MFAPFSTQFHTVLDTFKSVVLAMRPYKSAPPLQLIVNGGMHDKCKSDVQLDDISIGSEPSNDLVLLDPGVAPSHIHIAVSYSLLGPLATVTAKDAAAEANGHPVDKGDALKPLRMPINLYFGDGVSVELSRQIVLRPQRSFYQRARRKMIATVVGFGTLTAGLLVWEKYSGQMFVVSPNYVSATTLDQPSQIGISAKTFVDKLDQVGLGETLRVAETVDGFLEVRGRMSPSQARTWEAVAVWYDTTSVARPLLTYFQNAAELPVMPPISLVRLSAPQELVLSTGKAMGVNSKLSDDWRIAAIERDHIVIARGAERETLRFAGPAK